MTVLNIILTVIFSLFLLAILVAFVLSFFLTRRSYLQGPTRCPLEFGAAFEDVSFVTSDGLAIHGWFIPAQNDGRVVIVLHGHGNRIDEIVHWLEPLHKAGFNLLAFDLRGHGRSQGKTCTYGCLEQRDVLAAVETLKARGLKRIGLIGLSLGGMTAVLAAPHIPGLRALVDDGGSARLRTAVLAWTRARRIPDWQAKPWIWLAIAAASVRTGKNLFLYEPVRWIGRVGCPVMIIHGDKDVYLSDFDDMLQAAGEVELLRLPDLGHVRIAFEHPQMYFERLIDFLDRHL